MQTTSLVLKIAGLGNVPSFKNNKMLTRGKLITDPVKQKWMQRAIGDLESQLLAAYSMAVAETSTGCVALYLTAWSKRFDDSIHWIPEISVKATKCENGEEGADILIEMLP